MLITIIRLSLIIKTIKPYLGSLDAYSSHHPLICS
uniref:Uncharacterized protein n=1 Tax=Arundo donax TaxID=35708 RepID=A0A0A9F808_ARUDO